MTVTAMTGTGIAADPAARSGPPLGAAQNQWRLPLAIAAVVMLGGIAIALLAPSTGPANGYLDPASTQAAGTHALADLLADRGTQVRRVTSAAAAVFAAAHGASAIVVTSPDHLTGTDLRELAAAAGNLMIVEPSPAALHTLAPGVTTAAGAPIAPVQPGCSLAAAVLAGNADLGGNGLRLAPGSHGASCYSAAGSAFLAQYSPAVAGSSPRVVTILASGAPLQNSYLTRLGNAALALNLLSDRGQIAWLVPLSAPSAAPASAASFWSLVPAGAYLVTAELAIALLLTALWRARRLGPLVTEPLPVVVRASETTEGHARLYQASRSRDKAADALRTAVAARLTRALGLPAEPAADVLTAEIAARTSLSQEQARQLVFGPAPATDADLVALADDLDAMEREVRAQ